MVKNTLNEPETQLSVQDEKRILSKEYRQKARDILLSINSRDIEKASLQNKAVSTGILLDKSLLISGDPTSINVDIQLLMTAVEAIKARKTVEQEAIQRAMRQPPLAPVIEAGPLAEPAGGVILHRLVGAPASPGELEVRYHPVPLQAPAENG